MIKSAQRKDWEMEARSNQFLKAFLEVAEQFGVFAGLNGAKATEDNKSGYAQGKPRKSAPSTRRRATTSDNL